jgi:hypothetical protein
MQGAFASSTRRLNQREKDLARQAYQESVDLERVRIATTSVLAAPRPARPDGRPRRQQRRLALAGDGRSGPAAAVALLSRA